MRSLAQDHIIQIGQATYGNYQRIFQQAWLFIPSAQPREPILLTTNMILSLRPLVQPHTSTSLPTQLFIKLLTSMMLPMHPLAQLPASMRLPVQPMAVLSTSTMLPEYRSVLFPTDTSTTSHFYFYFNIFQNHNIQE